MCDDNDIMVTVAVPCYNHERYLRDCLEGIMMQQVDFGIEVLVIDDASTDGSRAIIDEYVNRFPHIIKPIYHKENFYQKGRCILLESLLPNIHGKYLAFCEGDDYWTYPCKLKRQIEFLESHKKYSGCCHHYIEKYIDNPNAKQTAFTIRHSRRLTVFDILIEPQLQTATFVMRSEIFKEDKELHKFMKQTYVTDVALFLATLNAGKIYGFREWWSVYRIHDKGLWQCQNRETQYNQYISNLHKLSLMYGRRYKGLVTGYKIHEKIRNLLASATKERKNGRILAFLFETLRAFCISPYQFLRICYAKYR